VKNPLVEHAFSGVFFLASKGWERL